MTTQPPELREVLLDAFILADSNVVAWQDHCAELETDYRFGWPKRGKIAHAELGDAIAHRAALDFYLEVLS